MAPTTDVGNWIAAQAAAHPTHTAIRFEDEAITYPAFAADCANLAAFLTAELKLDRGARVAYLGANMPELLALVFACAQTGCMFVPLSWRLAPSELDAILEDCTPAALFVEDSCTTLAATLSYVLPTSHRCGVRTADSRWREIYFALGKSHRRTARTRSGNTLITRVYLGHHRSAQRRGSDAARGPGECFEFHSHARFNRG